MAQLLHPNTPSCRVLQTRTAASFLKVIAQGRPTHLVRCPASSTNKMSKKVAPPHTFRSVRAKINDHHHNALADQKPVVDVKAIVRVKPTVLGFLKNLGVGQGLDGIDDLLLQDALQLELVSVELDPEDPELEKVPIKAYSKRAIEQPLVEDEVSYEAHFSVPADFGEIGAILVENEHRKELFLRDIVLTGLPYGDVTVNCDSWVHSKFDNPEKRIFFTNKSYLPSQTPDGLKRLRERELQNLRGNGEGERKSFDRIYDYDTYNDLGDPDLKLELKRPVLGGKQHPYPRRCRTGRPHSKKDPLSEKRSISFYVPRDEVFADVKATTFGVNTLSAVLHILIPALESIVDKDLGFPTFAAVDSLFRDGIQLPSLKNQSDLKKILPGLLKDSADAGKDALLFRKPEIVDRDELAWIRDEEFARETLAGVNPYSIKLVEEWPLKSKLSPDVYGPPESAITTELIEKQIDGHMTIVEAIAHKKIFILDYHDVFLPYVNKVREIQGTTLYGSRTLFFLTPEGTLKPLAIELARPPSNGKPQWKQVFTPSSNSTESWLWKLAKNHVLVHDSAHHQLISHWLRTHCCVEPYIIAANRQLSAVHPIYRLLYPHFRYTMEINSLAREALINADGTIETSFSARKYSMELSSVIYDQAWRFDFQGLPEDLISRGLAVEDSSAPHGLKLAIEDYPFANDGLLLWDSIKEWVSEYVNHYYPQDDHLVESDPELQAWWAEIKNKGHQDKKDEKWWPILKTRKDLIGIITSMIWVSSGHHAAVNFVQYTYAGYFPNRPTIARNKMPTEDPTEEEWNKFLEKPSLTLLESFPSKLQATKVMSVLEILSTHSADEEYIGDLMEPSWAEDPAVKEAFERFHKKLKGIEGMIDARNADDNLKNRHGAGTVPYESLKPFSKPGVTGMGVPNSISI